MRRGKVSRLVGFAALVATACAGCPGGETDGPQPLEHHPEISARVENAIMRACRWLGKQQDRKGRMKSSYAMAATSLAGLAWLASGSTPHEGPFAENIYRALEYVVSSQGRRGFITEQGGYAGPSGMYGHGYATQFLSQASGMVKGDLGRKVNTALDKAVRTIETTQNRFGGWNNSRTRITKGSKVLAEKFERIPTESNIHRRWFYLKVKRKGKHLEFYIDNQLVLECDDPEPLDGGRVAVWTYNNGIMVSRVRISNEDGEKKESPFAQYPGPCKCVYDSRT